MVLLELKVTSLSESYSFMRVRLLNLFGSMWQVFFPHVFLYDVHPSPIIPSY